MNGQMFSFMLQTKTPKQITHKYIAYSYKKKKKNLLMSGNQRPSIHPQQAKTQTKSNTYMSTMINYVQIVQWHVILEITS